MTGDQELQELQEFRSYRMCKFRFPCLSGIHQWVRALTGLPVLQYPA
jgi:hypothetical protein